jgi:hypothetical protein
MAFISKNQVYCVVIIAILAHYASYFFQYITKAHDAKQYTCQIFRSELNDHIVLTYNEQKYFKKFNISNIFTNKNEILCWTNLEHDIRLYPFKYDVEDILYVILTVYAWMGILIVCIIFLFGFHD